jgi:hypothetical protein
MPEGLAEVRAEITPGQARLWRELQAEARLAEERFRAAVRGILAGAAVTAPATASVTLEGVSTLVFRWPEGAPEAIVDEPALKLERSGT